MEQLHIFAMQLIKIRQLTLNPSLGCVFPLRGSISHTVGGCGSSREKGKTKFS